MIQTTQTTTNKQKVSISDFFKTYPYKAKDKGVYKDCYIPKYEIVDNHEFSITRKEYIEITKIFFQVILFEFLIWGNVYKSPHKFGLFSFHKCKNPNTNKKNIDFDATRKVYGEWNKQNPDNKKTIYHKNYHSQGYGVYLKWDKKEAFFGNKYATLFTLAKRQKLKLAQILKENPQIINYINE